MSDVLITYGWIRSSYAAMRNLKKHNVSVAVADTSKYGMCQFSRLKDSLDIYTSHYENEKKFIDDMNEICDARNIKKIFPSHNETEIIGKYKDRFTKEQVSLVPNSEHCKVFNNKSEAYGLVKDLGIPVPQRIEYADPNNISNIISELKVKRVVIKLLTGNSGKGVFYADSGDEAQKQVKKLIKEFKLEKHRYPQIEEFVAGQGFGCSVLFWKGKLITTFTHKRIREKIKTGGTSTFRESSSHRGIEDAAIKIFKSIGWHGLAMSEFKVCPETNKFWFIEVNPRMWGSIPLAIDSGVEFPYLLYLCSTEGPEAAIEYHQRSHLKLNWKAKWLLGEFFIVFQEILSLNLRNIFKILSKRADSLDDFHKDDPSAFFGQAIAYLHKGIKGMSLNPSEKGMLK